MISPLLSPRTLKYLAALQAEGDAFDYWAWLRRVREEEGCAVKDNITSDQARASGASSAGKTATIPRSRVAHPKPSRPISSKKSCIRQRLVRVSDAWDEFQNDRKHVAVYGYLKSVYRIVTHYKNKRRVRKLVRRACMFSGLQYHRAAEPFATIIRCTSGDELDKKTISKWARALRYAAHRRRPARRLKSFMQAMGGINACADRYAKMMQRAPKPRGVEVKLSHLRPQTQPRRP